MSGGCLGDVELDVNQRVVESPLVEILGEGGEREREREREIGRV